MTCGLVDLSLPEPGKATVKRLQTKHAPVTLFTVLTPMVPTVSRGSRYLNTLGITWKAYENYLLNVVDSVGFKER